MALSAVLAVGAFGLRLGTGTLQTLAFVSLVFGGQAAIYAIRDRRRLWGQRPSGWLLASSAADVAIASGLAIGGVAMTPLPALAVGSLLAAAVAFAFVLDIVKVPVFPVRDRIVGCLTDCYGDRGHGALQGLPRVRGGRS